MIRSPVNWALLGLVIERPSYGYELKARFERYYRDLLPVSDSSPIYKGLSALQKHKMIRSMPEANPVSDGTDRQPKRHYCATAHGRESYQEHLVEELRALRRNSQLLARSLAALADRPLLALEVLDEMEDACVQEAVRTPLPPPPSLSPADSASALAEDLAAEECRLAMEPNLELIQYARRWFKARAKGETLPR